MRPSDEDMVAVRCSPATTYLSAKQIEELKSRINENKPSGSTVTLIISADEIARMLNRNDPH